MRPLIPPLRRRYQLLARLDGADRRRALAMVPKLAFYRAGLKVLPFRRLARWALRPGLAPVRGTGASADEIVADTSQAVTRAAALLVGTSTCLAQALTVVEHLRQHGVGCELCIGVAKGKGADHGADNGAGDGAGRALHAIEAHAWVEVGGQVVHGATERQYERFSSLEEKL